MKKIPEYEALVLEGGSLRCAFTAGVLDGFASLGYRPFQILSTVLVPAPWR